MAEALRCWLTYEYGEWSDGLRFVADVGGYSDVALIEG